VEKKKNAIPGGFVAFPHALLNHPNFWSLSGNATKLLILIAAQYKGRNNGDFQAGWKYAKKRGWKSQDTLHKSKQELIEKGFIAETRKGAFPNTCSLYGVTWHALDINRKFDIKPSGFPVGAWNQNYPLVTNRREMLDTSNVQGQHRTNTAPVLRDLK
jgi:hypothetical protein